MSKRLFVLLIPVAAASAWGVHAAQTANTEAAPGGAVPAALSAADHVEIRNLAGRYSHALDLGEPAAWAEVFTEDGVMDMVAQGYTIEGDALRSLARDGEPSGSRHMPSTFVIDGAGDEATMRSYVTVVSTRDPARIVFQGRYEDRLRRVDGKWRIAQRRILTDWIDPVVAAGVAGAP